MIQSFMVFQLLVFRMCEVSFCPCQCVSMDMCLKFFMMLAFSSFMKWVSDPSMSLLNSILWLFRFPSCFWIMLIRCGNDIGVVGVFPFGS